MPKRRSPKLPFSYLKWDTGYLTGLLDYFGALYLYAEVDQEGSVFREIGIDPNGKIVHKCPSKHYPNGTYGALEGGPVDMSGRVESDISPAEFQSLWEKESNGR